MSSEPLLVVLSGPSGVGKDSVLRRLQELGYPFHYTVTATTRPRRPGETDGKDYHFVSEDWFERKLAQGGLLEHAAVYGRHYGVPRAPVVQALANGQDVILRTDVAGARTIRALAPGSVLVFIQPPSLEQLEDRLRRRQTDSDGDIELRLNEVRDEIAAVDLFDYEVVNQENDLDACVRCIAAIVQAEKCRVRRMPLGLQ